ncbi:MAG: radical SAM protein [Candidatus ainarchaeum sp.]|nr:radical SAM protein [Candidatus ainarchaeum sp.]
MTTKINLKVPAIDCEISGVCNMNCPCCWGTPRNMSQSHSLDEWFNLIKKFKEDAGLESVTLCGGEPLLVKRIENLAKKIKIDLGLEVYLQTNGTCSLKTLEAITPFLTNVSIPIEGSNEKISSIRRGKNHLSKVIKTLKFLNKNFPDTLLKVGTVVNSKNVYDLENIGNMLLKQGMDKRFPKKGVWKLYQMTQFGAGQDDEEWSFLRIDDKVFNENIKKIKQKFKNKLNITSISTKETGGYCLIIRPNGKVVSNSYEDGSEVEIFNDAFKNPKNAIKLISEYQAVSRVKNRLVKTYNFNWKKN